MGYRWRNKIDVDEAIVVIMNTLDQENELSGWLIRTINQSVKDSDPEMVTYFFEELKMFAPAAVASFEEFS